MMNVAVFLQSIDNARGRRSDKEISQAAGLSGNAVAAMRAGKVPSLERAARVAEVVGLELCLRWKGEAISPWALRLALELLFRHLGKSGAAPALTEDQVIACAEKLASGLIPAYGPFAELFDPSTCDDPEEQFRVSRLFGRYLGDVESKDVEGLAVLLGGRAAPAVETGAGAGQAADKTSDTDDEAPAT